MTRTPHPQDEVVHPYWGFGIVLGLKPGRRARVRFEKQPGLPRTVKRDQLMIVPASSEPLVEAPAAEPASPPVPVVPPDAKPTRSLPAAPVVRERRRAPANPPRIRVRRSIEPAVARKVIPPSEPEARRRDPLAEDRTERTPEEVAGYRQTIEALRAGVVPAEHVTEYTVGRDRQLDRLRELFVEARGLRVVWGEYGTGKSHLLDVAEQIALEAGFLTSRITLDRFEIPPSHPQRLYSAIATHLRYPGDPGTGLEPLLRRLTESRPHRSPGGSESSRFLSPYLHALWKENAGAIDWMQDYAHGSRVDPNEGKRLLGRSGWPGRPPLTLSDYRTYGRVYAHLVGTIASWSRDAGFRGLIVLFDEVEFIDSMDPQLWSFASEVLAHYTAVTLPRELLAFDPDRLYKGGHAVHRQIPLLFRENQPLGAIFALTPLPQIEVALRNMTHSDDHDVHVQALEPEEVLVLVDLVRGLYLRAYPGFRPPADLGERVRKDVQRRIEEGDDGPRSIVRTVCYWLDRERVS